MTGNIHASTAVDQSRDPVCHLADRDHGEGDLISIYHTCTRRDRNRP
jgi:hypothetical protein